MSFVDTDVDEDDRIWCNAEISEDEILPAVNQMKANKSPGSDGCDG